MKNTEAKRLIIDVSSNDPAIIQRIALSVELEMSRIVADTNPFPEPLFAGHFLRPFIPYWGTISYKLDPVDQNPAPTFRPGALAKVTSRCMVPSAVGQTVRLKGITSGYEERPNVHWNVEVDDPGSPWHGKPFGVFQSNMELIP